MTKPSNQVNGGHVPLQNMALALNALKKAINRPPMLPGIVCFYGPSGFGKSVAAAYCANSTKGILVECRSTSTAKTLLAAITQEAGLPAKKTLSDLQQELIKELALSRRPLIVDEVDHIAGGKTLEVLRDLHDASSCPVLLIGEESLPYKLGRTERFHNRVLAWEPAQPALLSDVAALAPYYAPNVAIAEDLREKVFEISGKVIRRICVNLHLIAEVAHDKGLQLIDLAAWGKRPFYTGTAPRREHA